MSMYSNIIKLPVLGYGIKLVASVILLPRKLILQNEKITDTRKMVDVATNKITNTNEQLINIINEVKILSSQSHSFDQKLSDIIHQLSIITLRPTSKTNSLKPKNPNATTLADNHLLDSFYTEFENKFRGAEKDIMHRQEVYVHYFKALKNVSKDQPVLDIGCGRGEFLQVMKANGIAVRGLDLNTTMVKKSRDKGFDVIEQDALSYLQSLEPNTLSAITGFHIVEHIPFADLMNIYTESYRTIKKDGFVLFETPNPENVVVGSLNFHYDPSHLKPIPPQLLAFCLEFCGFQDVEIIRLHPESEETLEDAFLQGVNTKLYGPRDYAVIAYKR